MPIANHFLNDEMKAGYICGALLTAFLVGGCHGSNYSHSDGQESRPLPEGSPYGAASDIYYARRLWQALRTAKMVGPKATTLEPFFGGARPHGMILEIISGNISIDSHTGFVVVKKNYDGEGVSVSGVKRNRLKYLSSITVMYQREAHYDEDNQNWFWVKYKPNGTLFTITVQGRPLFLAGRLMKGETQDQNRGCIYCHSSAGGGDYIFYPSISVPQKK